MHDELYAAIPDNVYTALDACAHLSPAQRSKLQEACKKSSCDKGVKDCQLKKWV